MILPEKLKNNKRKLIELKRGASFVTEYNPTTGQVRSWQECYDQAGNVNRVHPKSLNGQDLIGQHYPPTKAELESFRKYE